MKTLFIGANMKTLKTTLTIAALGLVTLLTGCATVDLQKTFTRGDEVLYGRVMNIWEKSREANETLCAGTKAQKYKEVFYSPEFDDWASQTGFCTEENLKKIQQVQVGIGIVNINGDGVNLGAFPSKDLQISKGDIVSIKVYPSSDGRFRRPSEILRVVAKAKDATKENGCYWDAGVNSSFRGFNQGGAVCEGWHWKNHPYSNPSLLKK